MLPASMAASSGTGAAARLERGCVVEVHVQRGGTGAAVVAHVLALEPLLWHGNIVGLLGGSGIARGAADARDIQPWAPRMGHSARLSSHTTRLTIMTCTASRNWRSSTGRAASCTQDMEREGSARSLAAAASATLQLSAAAAPNGRSTRQRQQGHTNRRPTQQAAHLSGAGAGIEPSRYTEPPPQSVWFHTLAAENSIPAATLSGPADWRSSSSAEATRLNS